MESTIDVFIKIIAAIGAAYGIVKTFMEFKRNDRINLYEDFKNSKEIAEYMRNNRDLHPIMIEKGLRCLAGTKNLSTDEIFYLFDLESPLRRVGQYIKASDYLVFNKQSSGKWIDFKGLYKNKIYRKLELCANNAGALVFLSIPSLSLFFYPYIPDQIGVVPIAAINMALVFSFWESIKACVYIEFAEEIVSHQEKDQGNLRERFIKMFDADE